MEREFPRLMAIPVEQTKEFHHSITNLANYLQIVSYDFINSCLKNVEVPNRIYQPARKDILFSS